MRRKDIKDVISHSIVILLLLAFSTFYIGCGEDNVSSKVEPVGEFITNSECGGFVTVKNMLNLTNNQSGIYYQYDGSGKLKFQHVNAGFNCCPVLGTDFSFNNDTIIITEKESGDMCHCLCLYDIECEINNLAPGTYYVKIVELYLSDGDELLEFEITLESSSSSGNFVVSRTNYPWGTGEAPSGKLSNIIPCNILYTGKTDITPPDDSNCIVYEFDSTNTLFITHQNTIFNCCPDSLFADITIDGNVISVYEYESLESGGCDCNCPWGLEMEVGDLTPGIYTIQVHGPYIRHWDTTIFDYVYDTLAVTVDLIYNPSGYQCFYPSNLGVSPYSEVSNVSGCLDKKVGTLNDVDSWATFGCFSYNYDNTNTLYINRNNTDLNCCFKNFIAEVNVDDNIIKIRELEDFGSVGGCYCMCSYDIDYQINNLSPGFYQVQVDYKYIDSLIQFPIDLINEPSGEYCQD